MMNWNGVSIKLGEKTRKENKEVRVVINVETSPANLESENTVLMAKA